MPGSCQRFRWTHSRVLSSTTPSSREDLETRMVVLLGPHDCHTLKAEKIRYLIWQSNRCNDFSIAHARFSHGAQLALTMPLNCFLWDYHLKEPFTQRKSWSSGNARRTACSLRPEEKLTITLVHADSWSWMGEDALQGLPQSHLCCYNAEAHSILLF